MKFKFLLLIAACSTLFVACEPKESDPSSLHAVVGSGANKSSYAGALIINQGSFHKNNSTISYYNFATQLIQDDIFAPANGRLLGDGAQDAIIYGSNLYVTVTESNMLWVMNPKTGVVKKAISLLDDFNAPRKPRSMAAYGGKVYITLFDGNLAKLDTTSLSVEKIIAVGPYPEEIVAANDLLYVAISGGMAAVKDSTVLVVDPIAFTALRKIKVTINPTKLVADSQGDVYVISDGDYRNIKRNLQRIAKGTEIVTPIVGYEPIEMAINKDQLYFFSFEANYTTHLASNKKFVLYDATTDKIVNDKLIPNDPTTRMLNCIDVDPSNGDIYIAETDYTNAGTMYVFNSDGSKKENFPVGLNGFKTVFVAK